MSIVDTTIIERQQIGWGDNGSAATLRKMRSIVNVSIATPIVVEQAHSIIRGLRARDQYNISLAIRFWLAQNFRFVSDPIGVELVRTPEYMLNQFHTSGYVSGDCDDAAVLGAALAKSVGVQSIFVAIGFQAFGPLSHVFTILKPLNFNKRISLDVTKPAGVTAQVRRRTESVV